jgi:hypothetical protein
MVALDAAFREYIMCVLALLMLRKDCSRFVAEGIRNGIKESKLYKNSEA